jgi:hypothetical protein
MSLTVADALMHLLLLTVFTIVLLRPSARDYFRQTAWARRPGAASIVAAVILSAPLAAVGGVQSAPPPPELQAIAAKAGLEGTLTAWCRAEFIPRKIGAFAVAVSAGAEGGRYVALEPNGHFSVLAAFQGTADLSCYTRDEARRLDSTIKRSETIEGAVRPRWNSTVVCGFVDNTSAFCWQYSTALRRFVEVGRWTT